MDTNGKRGDEAGFDKSKVKVYGLGLDGGSGGGNGQTQWSMYTGSNELAVTPTRTPGARTTTTTSPQFQETIGWFKSADRQGLHAQRRRR